MAKRTRGSTRPGQRRPAQRAAARPVERIATRPAEGLSADEEARAAELEARIVAEEREAEASRERNRQRGRATQALREDALDRTVRRSGQSLLAVKASQEYTYVARDLRRFLEVAGMLLAVMAVVFVLNVAGIVKV